MLKTKKTVILENPMEGGQEILVPTGTNVIFSAVDVLGWLVKTTNEGIEFYLQDDEVEIY